MRVSTTGPVSPAEAWRRYEELGLWAAWAPQITRVESADQLLAAGVTGRVVGPAGVSVRFAILDVEPARYRWSWKVWRGPVSAVLNHGIDRDDHGSRAWIDLHAPLPLRPLLLGYVPFAWYALHRLVTLPEI